MSTYRLSQFGAVTRRNLLCAAIAALSLPTVSAFDPQPADRNGFTAQSAPPADPARAGVSRPNVILIIMDDVGYGDVGSYGAKDIRTPNIDRLAREGIRFTDFYAAPTCSPTRASLISGRYYQRAGIERPIGAFGPATRSLGLPATGHSLPQLLKNGGYATGLVGKWHLGYTPEYSPRAHGFEYFFGFKSGYIDYYQHTDGTGAHDLFENDVPAHADGYMTDLITARAARFIDEHARRPFFLEVAYNAAHWPFQIPDHPSVAPGNGRFVQPQEDMTGQRRDYAAIVERADQGVGRILEALRANGLDRNTLVIYTHDNGGEWLSSNAPLFHRKDSVWEGGVRVPLIARWPARVPRGRLSPQVGITMDLTATILSVAGVAVPAEAKFDGRDLLPQLANGAPPVERTLYFRNVIPARAQRAVRQGDWKVVVDGPNTMVFDLKRDAGERYDLARERQDVARRLRPLLATWEADVDADAKQRTSAAAPR
jgi:arylsulfatase A-like enzyme